MLVGLGRSLSTTVVKTRHADYANPNLLDRETIKIPPPDYDMEEYVLPQPVVNESSAEVEVEKKVEYTDARPYWLQDINSLGKGPVGMLGEEEELFWKSLISRYLIPISRKPEQQERTKKELLGLRNKVVIAFFMIDILFIALIQTLQTIPVDISASHTPAIGNASAKSSSGYYVHFECMVDGQVTDQYIDPVGFAFLAVFGLFLVIQFLGMLTHRLFSLIQIVSSTVLCRNRTNDNMSYLKLTETMAKIDGGQQSPDTISLSSSTKTEADEDLYDRVSDRATNKVISRVDSERKIYATIDRSFAQRFLALGPRISSEIQDSRDRALISSARQRSQSIMSNRPPTTESAYQDAQTRQPRLGRTKTRARMDAMQDIARRRRELFSAQRQERIKKKFGFSDTEIEGEGRRIQRYIPEVRDIRAYSFLSDINSTTSAHTGILDLDEEE